MKCDRCGCVGEVVLGAWLWSECGCVVVVVGNDFYFPFFQDDVS